MTFRSYRRHNRKRCHSKNPYDPRCGCPLSVQFGWKKEDAVFEGKKLTNPQTKWSLGTRSWSEAQSKVTALEKRLKDFGEGKVVPKGKTIKEAVKEWLDFRQRYGKGNTKPDLMGRKLIEWCEKENHFFPFADASDLRHFGLQFLVSFSKLSDFAQAGFDTARQVILVGLRRPQCVFVLLPDLGGALREFCLEARPCVLVLSVVPILEQAKCLFGGKLGDSGKVLHSETVENLAALQSAHARAQGTFESFGRQCGSCRHVPSQQPSGEEVRRFGGSWRDGVTSCV